MLMNWVVEAARKAGHAVQATSVPGVAQRTGSTSYYLEISAAAAAAAAAGARGHCCLQRVGGNRRALAAGFVSPDRTTVISSTALVFSTAEKIEMGDRRYSAGNVTRAVEELKRFHLFMKCIQRHGRSSGIRLA